MPQALPDFRVEEMTIMATPSKKAWPDVPAICVFTGIVLKQDRFTVPHRVLLEKQCLQKNGKEKYKYQGEHRWVDANPARQYKLPFYYSYLEEKGRQLIFVMDSDGTHIEEALDPGFKPGTLSFIYSLDTYNVRPIRESASFE